MKFKLFSIMALGALIFTSCSDDDKMNTAAGVTVNMVESTIRLSEDQASSSSFEYIPVEVVGEANGPIKVTIALTPYGEDPAEADVNYIVTSNTITIPAGETTGGFQFYVKGDDIINKDRSFEAKIVSVEGAEVGANAATVVTLVDNEGLIPIYYAGLAGQWDALMNSTYDGPVQSQFNIVTVEEGKEGYGKNLLFVNFPNAGMKTVATCVIDGVNQEINVVIEYGQQVATMNHPNYGAGKIMLYPLSGTSYMTTGSAQLKFGFDLTSGSLVPDPEWNFGILVSFAAGMMLYDCYDAMTFTR